jgi:hypothetical protein
MRIAEAGERYRLPFDLESVIALIVDFALTFVIKGTNEEDVRVRIEGPFEFVSPQGLSQINPEVATELGPVLVLANTNNPKLAATADGTLEMAFEGSYFVIVRAQSPSFEAWHVTVTNGPLMIGGPGGHVTIFDR